LGYPNEDHGIPYRPLLAEVVGDVVLPLLVVELVNRYVFPLRQREFETCPVWGASEKCTLWLLALREQPVGGVERFQPLPVESVFFLGRKRVTFKMQLDAPSATASRHSRLYITPVEHSVPALENRWIPLTSDEYADDKPQLSPDGNILYFTSNRGGYHCLCAQRLNPRTKNPEGAAFAIQHLHDQ
jgi:hypothetical protein